MRIVDILIACLLALLWGVNYVFIKQSVTSFPPIFAMVLRFAIVAMLLSPYLFKVPREKLIWLFAISVSMGVCYFSLLFVGMRYVPAGESSILLQLQVPMAVLISALVLKEELTIRVVLGIVVALLGVIVTIGMPERGATLTGVLLLIAAALMSAISSVLIKAAGKIHPLQMNSMMALMAAPMLLVESLLLEHGQWQSLFTAGIKGYGSLLYVAVVSSIICYSIWFKLMQRYPVNKVVPFNLLVPVFGVLASSLMIGEPLIPHMLIGGLICIAGVALVVVKKGS